MKQIKGYYFVGVCQKCREEIYIGNTKQIDQPLCEKCGGKITKVHNPSSKKGASG